MARQKVEKQLRTQHGAPAVAATTGSPMAALVACFFFSGAASLILEVVWTRLLRLVFGSTTLAVSTILVAYMLGLGLGGLAGARVAARLRNGVRAYGWIEIGAGAYALLVPLILSAMPAINREVLQSLSFWPAAVARLLVVLLFLLPPTLLMGATLPILTRTIVRQRTHIARRVGLLYGINTLGAVAGTLAATFLLFPTLGILQTNIAGAMLAATVGLIALVVVSPRVGQAEVEAESAPARPATSDQRFARATSAERQGDLPALLAYGVVGFTALTYEVCWTRALAMILGSSIYAFSTMLAAFLTGIALGSLIARRWFERLRRPLVVYAGGIALLGVLSLITVLAFRALPSLFVEVLLRLGTSPGGMVATNIGISILAMIGPTLVLGALFPLLVRSLAGDDEETSAVVGRAYFANTIGSATGALAAGFVLIPTLGLQRAMALAIGADLATAGLLLLCQRQWVGNARNAVGGLAVAAAVLVSVLPLGWSPEQLSRGVYKSPRDQIPVGIEMEPLAGVLPEGLLFYREGINTTVSVHREIGDILLRVNGKIDASTSRDMNTQILIGQVPMLFGARPERVLVIGLASAVTVGSVALSEPRRLDVVELEPAMVEASHYFDEHNQRPLERKSVDVIADDGRNLLAYTPERYDRVISEPSNPWITGAASLFTREFFAAARRTLEPGGQLLQWVQLYGMPPAGLAAVLAALQSEFPYVYGFSQRGLSGDQLLLARDRPLGPDDIPDWDRLSEPVRADLQRIGLFSSSDLWALISHTPESIRRIAEAAEVINSDDNMFVETVAPWSLYQNDTAENVELLASAGAALPVLEAAGRRLDAAQVAELAMSYLVVNDRASAEALLAESRERGRSAEALVVEAVMQQLDGENPRALLDEAASTDPRSFLARLRRAQFWLDEGDAEDALRDADAALELQPVDPRARFIRLRALADLGHWKDARADAESLRASPYAHLDREVHASTALVAANLGDPINAVADARRFVAADPSDPSGWYVLSEYYRLAGRSAEAEEAAENQRRSLRNVARDRHAQALRALHLGQRHAAIQLLRSAVDLVPDYEPAQAELDRLGR